MGGIQVRRGPALPEAGGRRPGRLLPARQPRGPAAPVQHPQRRPRPQHDRVPFPDRALERAEGELGDRDQQPRPPGAADVHVPQGVQDRGGRGVGRRGRVLSDEQEQGRGRRGGIAVEGVPGVLGDGQLGVDQSDGPLERGRDGRRVPAGRLRRTRSSRGSSGGTTRRCSGGSSATASTTSASRSAVGAGGRGSGTGRRAAPSSGTRSST